MSFLVKRILVLFIDLLIIPIAWYGAYWLRFNLGAVPQQELAHVVILLPFWIVIQMSVFWFLGLYRGIWKFASLPDFIKILKVVFVGVLLSLIVLFFVPFSIPRSIMPIYSWLLVSFLGGTRLLYRWFKSYLRGSFKSGKRTMIVGAGQAADLLLRELIRGIGADTYNVVTIVDDDKAKVGCDLHGVRVAGGLYDIPDLIDKYDIEIAIIAMPSASSDVIRKVVDCCKEAKIESRTVPGLNAIVSGDVTINSLRDVLVEDLLGRDQVTLDWEGIAKAVTGKKILVSGGGGSIGSELCRQISCLSPDSLIVIDNSEFNLYSIDKELREKFPKLNLVSCLVDVVDLVAIQKIMSEHKPNLVFHAAAYKHVPLLEYQARAAIRNNVLGTYNIAKVSADCDAEIFTLISTDKAVNPSNVMGATKRAAEIICQNFNGRSKTNFLTVRFGNVLASAGSVIPLFREQLSEGRDLTVTHPEVTRYFMTIPEATQLILQATILGNNGDIFVLDMGEPIKIKDLAEQMIYLSGKKIGKDVNITYIGLRPGEKLYEELFYNSEELLPTPHLKIKLAQYQLLDWDLISSYLNQLDQMCTTAEEEEKIKTLLKKMVPEYIAQ